jgi:hypothetical protein
MVTIIYFARSALQTRVLRAIVPECRDKKEIYFS